MSQAVCLRTPSQELPGSSRTPRETPGSPRKPQEAPGSSQELPGSPRSSQEAPRSPKKFQGAPGNARELTGSSMEPQEAPGSSMERQEAPVPHILTGRHECRPSSSIRGPPSAHVLLRPLHPAPLSCFFRDYASKPAASKRDSKQSAARVSQFWAQKEQRICSGARSANLHLLWRAKHQTAARAY